jgi:hypothetical protein
VRPVRVGYSARRAHLTSASPGCRLTAISDFAAVNQIYGKRFPADPPARATFAVAALPLGAKVRLVAPVPLLTAYMC